MNNIMTPSEMTKGQIDKAVANYRAMLEKYAPDFQSTPVQAVLGSPELAKEQLKLLRTLVEAESALVTRTASVDRALSSKEALSATGRALYLNDEVVASWPPATGDSVTMLFYSFSRYIEAGKLDEELAKVGLELVVDPTGLAAINQAYPEFADTHPNATQWKNAAGKFCYALFNRWDGERDVNVDQSDADWRDYWWFSVRRK
jgi:hypothetical protein